MRVLPVMVALLLVTMTPMAAAQLEPDEDPLSGSADYTVEVYLGEAGADLRIHPAEIVVAPGARVTFHVVNVGATDHDFTFLGSDFEFHEEDMRERADGGQAVMTPLLEPGEEYNLTVFFPGSFTGAITYICSVPGHRQGGMEGTLHVGAAAEEEAIESFGVDYLAYWVGIISFVILFVVLFATFFLFRYGESKNVVDHRTGAATVTAAAAEADTGGAVEEEGFLPDPSRLAIVLSLIAIGLWFLTEFTSVFG